MSKQSLSPDQVDAILQAAAPLAPYDHAAFLEDVSVVLADLGEVGDGTLHRIVRDVQRKHFDPPDLSRRTGRGRWG